VMILFAVLTFFIGRGLWKRQKWARIVAIILAILSFIGAIMGMVQGMIVQNLFSLVVNLVIGAYLLFSKSVKAAFK